MRLQELRSRAGPALRSVLFATLLSAVGCAAVRPMAQHGVDVLENSERSYVVRSLAAVGSVLGSAASLPFSILLFPTCVTDAWGWGVREPTDSEGASAPGDYAVPLAGVPFEYGIGLGSCVVAAPFAFVEDLIFGDPPRGEGWLEEEQEDPEDRARFGG